MASSQEKRLLAIETPLGADVLTVRSVTIQEQLSRLFQIEVELTSTNGGIEFKDIVGHNVTLRLSTTQKDDRYFNGFVSRFSQGSNEGSLAHYSATIVPWTWFLTRTADCRIFQEKSIPDIVEAVFKAHGFSDFKLSLSGTYEKKEYCVQYRETDFNFVSRLLEQAGICFFFLHENGKHVMVLADSISASKPAAGYEKVMFQELAKGGRGREVMTDWTVEKEVFPVAYSLTDFDFKKPNTSLLTSVERGRDHGAAKFEVFDYPGDYTIYEDGKHLAGVRLDELQAQHEILRGTGGMRGLGAGHTFALTDHPREDQAREYLITAATIRAEEGEIRSGLAQTGGGFFSCDVTAIPSSQPFRPARATPRPVVQGPQTARIVGPSGQEIHTDEHGRVKVLFPWDRHSKADDTASGWMRVAQTAAGKNWGAISLPRVGQEVIVEFLEGDPDRPIITGRVYNAECPPPYKLPGEKTKSTVKTNSTPDGGGFNEIRFEDKKGDEQIFIHGEKNEDVRIKNDCFEWIGNNRHLIVKKDQVEHVENNRHETVDQDHVEKIGKDRHLKVGGKEAKEVVGTHSFRVTGDVGEEFGANHSEVTKKDYFIKADNLVIEGVTSITVKVGNNYIAIAKDGIKIGCDEASGKLETSTKGDTLMKALMNVTVEATQNAGIKGTAGLKLESPANSEFSGGVATVKASGPLTVQGAVVKIN